MTQVCTYLVDPKACENAWDEHSWCPAPGPRCSCSCVFVTFALDQNACRMWRVLPSWRPASAQMLQLAAFPDANPNAVDYSGFPQYSFAGWRSPNAVACSCIPVLRIFVAGCVAVVNWLHLQQLQFLFVQVEVRPDAPRRWFWSKLLPGSGLLLAYPNAIGKPFSAGSFPGRPRDPAAGTDLGLHQGYSGLACARGLSWGLGGGRPLSLSLSPFSLSLLWPPADCRGVPWEKKV